MRYFVLTEKVMNGTFVMDIMTSLVEADNFELAKGVLKRLFFAEEKNITVISDDNKIFSYKILGNSYQLFVVGILKNEEVKILK